MRVLLAVTCLVAVATAVSLTGKSSLMMDTPSKPMWQTVFDSAFGLNVPSVPGYVNLTSHFWYDWTDNQNTMIAYPDKCVPFVSTKKGCNLIFNNNGTYTAFAIDKSKPIAPGNQECCLLFPGIGSVPPNFLKPFNFSGVTTAMDLFNVSHKVNRWDGISGFSYWTDVSTGADIQFRDGTTIYWNFGPLNFRANPNPNSMFNTSMCSQKCEGSSMESHFDGGAEGIKALKPQMLTGPLTMALRKLA